MNLLPLLLLQTLLQGLTEGTEKKKEGEEGEPLNDIMTLGHVMLTALHVRGCAVGKGNDEQN